MNFSRTTSTEQIVLHGSRILLLDWPSMWAAQARRRRLRTYWRHCVGRPVQAHRSSRLSDPRACTIGPLV